MYIATHPISITIQKAGELYTEVRPAPLTKSFLNTYIYARPPDLCCRSFKGSEEADYYYIPALRVVETGMYCGF
jgi:hypothetical protein